MHEDVVTTHCRGRVPFRASVCNGSVADLAANGRDVSEAVAASLGGKRTPLATVSLIA
jgi:hypothetical protein